MSPASSSQSRPLSAAVVAAKRSARSDRSVAVTAPAWVDRCSACTPQPVPRSSAVPTGRADGRAGERRGGVADAEHVVGAQRARAGRRRPDRTAPTSPARCGRCRRRGRPPACRPSPYALDQPGRERRVERQRGERGRDRVGRLGLAGDEQPDQRGQPVPVGGGPQQRPEVVAAHRLDGRRADPVGDARAGVAGR